jgi:hypothetical protein
MQQSRVTPTLIYRKNHSPNLPNAWIDSNAASVRTYTRTRRATGLYVVILNLATRTLVLKLEPQIYHQTFSKAHMSPAIA